MFAAFTLVALYLSNIFPNMKYTFYFLSSVFVMGVLVENMVGMAFMMFAVVSGVSLLILPIHYALPYIILFGHYGIGKYLIETRIRNRIAAFVIKLIYFDVFLAGMYFAVVFTGILPMTAAFEALPVWAWALIAQPVFVVYDFVMSRLTGAYVNTVRNRIIRNS